MSRATADQTTVDALELLAELVSEVRLLRLAMQGEAVDAPPPPSDQAFLTLAQLADFAPASKKTLKEWATRDDNPMPVTRRPNDNAMTIQWGAFKKWYAEQDQADAGDTVSSEAARGVLISMREGRN